MKEIFRWINGEDINEYRFTDEICDGFFTNGVESGRDHKGKELTPLWRENLTLAGFMRVTDNK